MKSRIPWTLAGAVSCASAAVLSHCGSSESTSGSDAAAVDSPANSGSSSGIGASGSAASGASSGIGASGASSGSGTTSGSGSQTADGSVTDARADADATLDVSSSVDGPSDASAYLACFDSGGRILDSIKACSAATDCVARTIPSCCGPTYQVVAVNQSHAAAYDTCIQNAPSCGARGCASFPFTVAEDGTMIPDGGVAKVHCSGTDGGPMLCQASAQ